METDLAAVGEMKGLDECLRRLLRGGAGRSGEPPGRPPGEGSAVSRLLALLVCAALPVAALAQSAGAAEVARPSP